MQPAFFCRFCGAGLATGRFCPDCGAAVALGAGPRVDAGAEEQAKLLGPGLAALRGGDIDRALPLLAAAARQESPFGLLAYGTALLRRNRYAAALEPLARAAELLPERGEAHAYLAMARLLSLDVTGAREAMEQALQLTPQSFAVRLKHTELLLRLGYYLEAAAEAEHTLRLSAPDAESLAFAERLTTIARQKGRYAYTRPPGRLPRLSLAGLLRRFGRREATAPAGRGDPQVREGALV